MLVLTRRKQDTIQIGENICVKVIGIGRGAVKLAIDAPRDVTVHREEVYRRIQAETAVVPMLPEVEAGGGGVSVSCRNSPDPAG